MSGELNYLYTIVLAETDKIRVYIVNDLIDVVVVVVQDGDGGGR